MDSTQSPGLAGISPADLASLKRLEPLLWPNPNYDAHRSFDNEASLDPHIAISRFGRCARLMSQVFPPLRGNEGHLHSPLVAIPQLQRQLAGTIEGAWLIKRDDALPVAGSIKARGGFHEVLTFAERLALEHGIIAETSDRSALAGPAAHELFQQYTIAVGSTGNLGMAIGLIAKALGFGVTVHMSADAKAWKKDRLRAAHVNVVEHVGDYAAAVEAGRHEAESDPFGYFVDDENSADLFLGYTAAAEEVGMQLAQENRKVDAAHPLFVYLPCGVGGAPGGVAYGLKRIYGEHVHCFFAEPTASPCMLVALAGTGERMSSVYEFGLSNHTEADGLAVAQASPLVAPLMRSLLSGVFTVSDDTLLRDTYALMQTECMLIEPSAAAAIRGPLWLMESKAGQDYLAAHHLGPKMAAATHVLWSTGGSLVPASEHEVFQREGKALCASMMA